MFTVDNSITDLKVKERNIFKIIYSMNSHPVATPEMSVEEARCYILFFSEGANLSSYIGLYLPRTDRKFFYSYTSNPFPFEAGADVENDARQFAEDMGFLLDEINVSGMAVEDRNHWIEDQYIFGYKKPETIESDEAEPEEEKAVPEEAAAAPHPPASVPAAQRAEHAAAPAAPATAPAVAAPAAPAEVVPSSPAAAPAATQPAPPPLPEQPAPQPYYPGYPPQQGQPYPQQYPPQQGQPYPPPQPYPGYPPQQGQPYPQQYPPQPYPGYPPQGQPYPQQYPPQPGMPPYPQAPQQPPVLDVPELDEPAAPPPARAKAAPPPKPAAKKKAPAPKPAPPQRKPVPDEVEEELPVEVQIEAAPRQPGNLMEEAIRKGVVRPPKQKVQAGPRSATGTVARDKEALARLLSSF